jgi:hypothetical protein
MGIWKGIAKDTLDYTDNGNYFMESVIFSSESTCHVYGTFTEFVVQVLEHIWRKIEYRLDIL